MAEIEVNILDLNDNAPEFTNYDEIYYPNRFKVASDTDDIDDQTHRNRTRTKESQFSLPVYKAYLNKNTEPATFVKQISAVDRDFAGNGNGLVMFSLQHAQLPYSFEIDSRDGIITTVSKFNRFHGYEHLNLTVLATDLGSPSRTSTALLLVNLQGEDMFEDDEENRLFPHKYYEVEVPENNEVPMFLVQLNVSAMYREDVFRWSIVPEMEMVRADEFKIDSRNGSLWLVKSLDREAKDTHKIKVRAERVLREGRNYPVVAYPVVDGERIKGLQDNEIRVIEF